MKKCRACGGPINKKGSPMVQVTPSDVCFSCWLTDKRVPQFRVFGLCTVQTALLILGIVAYCCAVGVIVYGGAI